MGDDYNLDDLRLDANDAFHVASRYHAELREIYRYFMPWRLPTSERAGNASGRTEGSRLGNESVFDATGLSAAASFVANMQADWFPHFQPIFKAEAGPLYPADGVDEFNRGLETATKVVHGLLPQTRVTVLEPLQDLFAGTGAMFLEKGERDHEPIRPSAVPIYEMAMANGPWGPVDRWWWKRNWKARHIPELWPDAKIGDRLWRQIKQNRNSDVEVCQYTFWDARQKRYMLRSWTPVDDTILRKASYRTTPWITPRMFVVPGESFGRGLAHLALPSVKSLNKARELALRAAAFALLGLWMRRHDGVFNPETAVMAPGRMWKVAHTSGPLKSIERLDVPNNFDISNVVMKDEREQVRRVTLDDELPELADRVRSPTEIAGRMRRFDRNRGGNTVRFGAEMIVPIARRSFDISEELGILPTNLKIDQSVTQVTVLSPAAVAARAADTERLVSFLQIVAGLFGPQAVMLVSEIEKVIPKMARDMGIDANDLRTQAGTKELQDRVAQYLAQIQASEQAKAVQAKAMVEPDQMARQQYMEGAV